MNLLFLLLVKMRGNKWVLQCYAFSTTQYVGSGVTFFRFASTMIWCHLNFVGGEKKKNGHLSDKLTCSPPLIDCYPEYASSVILQKKNLYSFPAYIIPPKFMAMLCFFCFNQKVRLPCRRDLRYYFKHIFFSSTNFNLPNSPSWPLQSYGRKEHI